MLIRQTNNLAYVEQYEEQEMQWLLRYLSVKETKFRKDYKTGRSAHAGYDTISFVRSDHSFPAGFTKGVVQKGRARGFTFDVRDDRQVCTAEPTAADISFLRDYQLAAVDAVLAKRRGLLKIPTGGGKSSVAVGLVMRMPCAWLFLVQAKDLLHQMADRYTRYTGLQPGLLGDGKRIPPDEGANLTVATVQTLTAGSFDTELGPLLEQVEGLIVDEAHMCPAANLFRLAMSSERAFYRIGMSGTPLARGDQRSLLTIGALGPIIYEVAPEQLIQAGWLSRPDIKMRRVEQHADHKTYAGAYGALVVKSQKRNRAVVDMMERAAKPNLTFVKNIEHGRILAALAKARGLQVEFVWGSKSTKERQAAIKRLVRGDIDCIVSSKVFFVGVDIPELLSVVIGTAGRSVIETLQRIGRGMRVVEGKRTFEVWDVYDTGHRNMETHARARKNAYQAEGYGVTVEDGTE